MSLEMLCSTKKERFFYWTSAHAAVLVHVRTRHEAGVKELWVADGDVGIGDGRDRLVLKGSVDLEVVVELNGLLDDHGGEAEDDDHAQKEHKGLEAPAPGSRVPDQPMEAGVLRQVLRPLPEGRQTARALACGMVDTECARARMLFYRKRSEHF